MFDVRSLMMSGSRLPLAEAGQHRNRTTTKTVVLRVLAEEQQPTNDQQQGVVGGGQKKSLTARRRRVHVTSCVVRPRARAREGPIQKRRACRRAADDPCAATLPRGQQQHPIFYRRRRSRTISCRCQLSRRRLLAVHDGGGACMLASS